MKNNKLVIVLVLIILGLSVFIVYDKITNDENKNCNESENNKNITKEKREYSNLQNVRINIDSKSDSNLESSLLYLQILNGKLLAKLENIQSNTSPVFNKIEINGLEENIKSVVYESQGCGNDGAIIVVAINEKNELFYSDVSGINKEENITFKKINLNEKIKDIDMTEFSIGFSTCGERHLFVVFDDGKEYPLIYNEQDDNFSIDKDVDISTFKTVIPQLLVVYNDDTIGKWDSYGKYADDYKNKIQYKGENVVISKFYNRYSSYDSSDNNKYIVSNNKLYELNVTYSDGIEIDKIELKLVNDSNIKSESTNTSKNDLYYFFPFEEDNDITVTFENGDSFIITNVLEVYNFN